MADGEETARTEENIKIFIDPEDGEVFFGPVTQRERLLISRLGKRYGVQRDDPIERDASNESKSKRSRITEAIKRDDGEVCKTSGYLESRSNIPKPRSAHGKVAKELFRGLKKSNDSSSSPCGKINKSINSFLSKSLIHNSEQDLDASFELINIKDDFDDSLSNSCNLLKNENGNESETSLDLNKNVENFPNGVGKIVKNLKKFPNVPDILTRSRIPRENRGIEPNRTFPAFRSDVEDKSASDSLRGESRSGLPTNNTPLSQILVQKIIKSNKKSTAKINQTIRTASTTTKKGSSKKCPRIFSRIPVLTTPRTKVRDSCLTPLTSSRTSTVAEIFEKRENREAVGVENKDPNMCKQNPSVPCKIGFVKKEINRWNGIPDTL